jgi:hypothetical protein
VVPAVVVGARQHHEQLAQFRVPDLVGVEEPLHVRGLDSAAAGLDPAHLRLVPADEPGSLAALEARTGTQGTQFGTEFPAAHSGTVLHGRLLPTVAPTLYRPASRRP